VERAPCGRPFRHLKGAASAGIEGETVASYEQALEGNLRNPFDSVLTGGGIGRNPFAAPTSPNRMADKGRSAYQPWRTRSFRVR
jgi:hypothetical protein